MAQKLNQSERVQRWRSRTKRDIIDSLGGKCCVCGYHNCYASLELHHVEKEEKKYTISNLLSRPQGREVLAREVSKCVLLCANCHGEHHVGVCPIPEDAIRLTFEEAMIVLKRR